MNKFLFLDYFGSIILAEHRGEFHDNKYKQSTDEKFILADEKSKGEK